MMYILNNNAYYIKMMYILNYTKMMYIHDYSKMIYIIITYLRQY